MHRNIFTVEIVTHDRVVDDNELKEMAEKIARAIANETRSGEGIVPENSETFTEVIYVTPAHSNEAAIEHP